MINEDQHDSVDAPSCDLTGANECTGDRFRLTARRLSAWWRTTPWPVRADTECAEAATWWRDGVTPPTNRSPGSALRIIGPLRSVDQPDRRTASRGPYDRANRGAAQRGRVSHPKIPEGLHEHVGAEALVALRADPWEDRYEATHRHEWWLPDLAGRFKCQWTSLRIWAIRGWVRSRQVPPRGLWVVWADGRERRRLWKLMADSRSSKSAEQTSS